MFPMVVLEDLEIPEQSRSYPKDIEEPVAEEASSSRDSPYWVSISRKTGSRRLHARHQCGFFPWNVGAIENVWHLKSEVADAWCKVCARKLGIEKCEVVQGSSSRSSSSTEVEKAAEDRMSLPILCERTACEELTCMCDDGTFERRWLRASKVRARRCRL